jgi:hypothetical protein
MRFLYAIAFMLAVFAPEGWARDCTKAEAMSAEAKAAYLKSWAEVYDAYKRYAHCDDGAIAEGFSESVTVLLAKHWAQLPELVIRVNGDKDFRAFVVKHINESADVNNLKLIDTNARTRCPEQSKSFCSAIAARTQAR